MGCWAVCEVRNVVYASIRASSCSVNVSRISLTWKRE
jgi:hypothetical protein